MKKALSLLLALVMCLGLCACGNGNNGGSALETKDSLLAKAEKLDVYAFGKALDENIVSAEAKYKGKIILLTGYITKLDKEGITLRSDRGDNFHVNLTPEDIAKVYVNQFIDIVGVLTQVDGGLVVDNAYFVNDTYTISGTVVFGYYNIDGRIALVDDLESSACMGLSEYWEFWLQNTNDDYNYNLNIGFASNIKHNRGERISSIDYHGVTLYKGDKITMTVKMELNGNSRMLCEIISIKNDQAVADTETNTNANPLRFRSIVLSDLDTANHVLQLWKDGEATDASMKELMDVYGADQAGGQLYELYYPEDFISEIASWCLDPSRSAGDTTILETEYGYAIVYIVSLGNS